MPGIITMMLILKESGCPTGKRALDLTAKKRRGTVKGDGIQYTGKESVAWYGA